MKETGLRVLLVHNYYKQSGGEDTVFLNERDMLEKHGYQVFTYTRSNKEMDNFSLLQKLLVPIDNIFSWKTFFEVRKMIHQNKIDVVHVHNTLPLISASVFYASFSRHVPVVQTIHNFRMLCPGGVLYKDGQITSKCVDVGLRYSIFHRCYHNSFLQSLIVSMAMFIHRKIHTYRRVNFICLTEFNQQMLLRLNDHNRKIVDPERVFIKPNFNPQPLRRHPLQSIRENYVMYVGRLEESKGVMLLLRSWTLVHEQHLRLKIFGSGPLLEKMRQYIDDHDLANIDLMGRKPHDKIVEFMGKARAVIVPSKWYEGFPMVIPEAYSVGTPIIGTNIGNIAPLVVEEKSGLLFNYNDPKDLARAINKVSVYEFDYESIYAEYEKKYSESANFPILRHIYSELVATNKGE